MIPTSSRIAAKARSTSVSAGYFWAKARINVKADRGSRNQDVQACFHLVGGAGGLPARRQFFRYAYFVLDDAAAMPMESGLIRQPEDDQ